MKILITGSEGVIGHPLCIAMTLAGHVVYRVDLAHQPDDEFFMRADVGDYRQIRRALMHFQPEMVYHLAAEFGRLNGEDYYEQLWRSNVVGTKHILMLQREMRFKMVFASSSEVYGESGLTDLREDMLESTPVRYYNDYAMTKRVNEWQIQNAVEKDGLQVMILRFFNVYGPGEYYHKYRSVVCLFCYRALNNLPVTVYRDYRRVFLYSEDFIAGMVRTCNGFTAGQVFNLGGIEYRSVEDLMSVVRNNVPDYPENLITWKSKESMNVANKRPVVERAVSQFGWLPTTELETGVPKTLEWMRTVYPKLRR